MTELLELDDLVAAETLSAGDALIAARLGGILGESDPLALAALALAVRGVRHGSTCFDPSQPPESAPERWPDSPAWLRAVERSRLGSILSVEHQLVYLDRYRQLEADLCADLLARASAPPPALDERLLTDDLDRIFPHAGQAEQRAAAERAARRGSIVLTGGPGTGKTTTVAGLLAVLRRQWPVGLERPMRAALAAPTGKAAARMREAIGASAARLALDDEERAWLTALPSSTLHRLLGWRPDNRTRFRHDRRAPLPHDVVVVDETSMASLEQMARLLEALRPDARLVLVGDADQLASVEAGAVLHDVVAGWSPEHVVRLTRSHRFGESIGRLAAAIRDGDADTAIELLTGDDPAVRLISPPAMAQVLNDTMLPQARGLIEAGRAGRGDQALALMARHRLLCAHREGPFGAATWNRRITAALRHEVGYGRWHPGQPVMVTRNDAQLGVFNGDAGVVIDRDGEPVVALDGHPIRHLSPSRLPDTVGGYAMTIHRGQGSEFDDVTVLLPDSSSRVMTRELLYTAVTRAVRSITLVGEVEDIRAAVTRRVARSSGIAERLLAHPTVSTPSR